MGAPLLAMPLFNTWEIIQTLATLLPIQLPVEVLKKAAKDGSIVWAPENYMGDWQGIPCLLPVFALV